MAKLLILTFSAYKLNLMYEFVGQIFFVQTSYIAAIIVRVARDIWLGKNATANLRK